jgi:hypothetical protein
LPPGDRRAAGPRIREALEADLGWDRGIGCFRHWKPDAASMDVGETNGWEKYVWVRGLTGPGGQRSVRPWTSTRWSSHSIAARS